MPRRRLHPIAKLFIIVLCIVTAFYFRSMFALYAVAFGMLKFIVPVLIVLAIIGWLSGRHSRRLYN